jgi:hypothetical protein
MGHEQSLGSSARASRLLLCRPPPTITDSSSRPPGSRLGGRLGGLWHSISVRFEMPVVGAEGVPSSAAVGTTYRPQPPGSGSRPASEAGLASVYCSSRQYLRSHEVPCVMGGGSGGPQAVPGPYWLRMRGVDRRCASIQEPQMPADWIGVHVSWLRMQQEQAAAHLWPKTLKSGSGMGERGSSGSGARGRELLSAQI